jgi:hypothetical protein
MRQLVGTKCVICLKSIDSILEGAFCDTCGSPRHHACLERREQGGADAHSCSQCGGDMTNPDTVAWRREQEKTQHEQERGRKEEQRVAAAAAGGYPVSETCPNCGHREYKQRKPEQLVAFRWDRVCKACGTRYTPPTPLWAALVFILAGLGLAGFAFISLLLHVASGSALALPAMSCEALLGVMGVLAIVYGIRSLANMGGGIEQKKGDLKDGAEDDA